MGEPTAEALKSTMDKLKLTNEEVNRFEKAFKDPKFMDMFSEYAREISDPKARAESEAYLRQIEAENQVESVYGEGVKLIVPEPAFLVKTKTKQAEEGDADADVDAAAPASGTKVFLNVCTSDKVGKPESERSTKEGQSGSAWQIPFSLGKQRETKDKGGRDAIVFDFVVHPETESRCAFPPFRDMVVTTAIESAERQVGVPLDRNFASLKKKYMPADGLDKPSVLAVRPNGGKAGDRPPANKGTGDGTIRPTGTPDLPGAEKESPATRSPFSFERAATSPASAAVPPLPPAEGAPGYVYPSGERVPEFCIVRSGEFDLADTMGGGASQADGQAARRPKKLVVRVTLPGVSSARGVSLEVTAWRVVLCVPGRYRLECALPFEVRDADGRAKFDKRKQSLEVTLPVVPPPKAEAKPFVPPLQEPEEKEEESKGEEGREAKGGKGGEETREGGQEEAAPADAGETQRDEDAAPNASPAMTENERRWHEMHAARAAEANAQAEAAPAGEAAEEADAEADAAFLAGAPFSTSDAFVASPRFRGGVPGYVFKRGPEGVGYYLEFEDLDAEGEGDVGGAGAARSRRTAQTKSELPRAFVKPSITTDLCDEID